MQHHHQVMKSKQTLPSATMDVEHQYLEALDLTTQMLAAAEANDIKQVNQIDREFHDTLIELSGHSLLLTSWNVVSMRVRQVMALLNRRNSNLKKP